MIHPITIVFILLAISLSSSVASAVIDNSTVQYYVSIHNSMIDNAPQFVKSLAGNETIDFNITRSDGSIYRIALEMKNAHVRKIDEGGISDSTVSINATEDAISRIIGSSNPLSAFLLEIRSGGLDIQMHHGKKGTVCPFP